MLMLSTMDRFAKTYKLLACASEGTGGNDEARLRAMLDAYLVDFVPFDRKRKRASFLVCLDLLRKGGFDLFVLEGTGIAAGFAAIVGRLLYGRRYVLSSGDAVAPFLSSSMPLAWPVFALYEWLLYRCCSGFIGWTPYLVGRALTMGAARGATVPGWAPFPGTRESLAERRQSIRGMLGIPVSAVVYGIAGALVWSDRYSYCYGAELVRAVLRSSSTAVVIVVGDGSGLEKLKQMAGPALGKTIFLPGRLPREQVPGYLAAMDVGSLPQSVDGVGNFRYSTKISEYRQVGLPFVTNETPMSYDLDDGDVWRLPGDSPWSESFVVELSHLMNTLTHEQIAERAQGVASSSNIFDRQLQLRRFTAFLEDVLASVAR
jgi:hypothetical protein